jgi:hypothetical protein
MYIDKDGEVFEHTYTSPDGRVTVHHHGTKEFTPEQNERLSEIMSRAWDVLPDHVKDEINRNIELKRKRNSAIS